MTEDGGPSQQPQPDPQGGSPAPGSPYGQSPGQPQAPPPYPQPGGPPPAYGHQQPYPQAPYQYPPGQPAWGGPGQVSFPTYTLPDLPKATAALVVGLVAVAGGFLLCGVPLLASPVAWVLGAQARRQVREAPQQWGGEGKATAGMVLGIVGTILLVLLLIAVIVIVVVTVNDPNFSGSDTSV